MKKFTHTVMALATAIAANAQLTPVDVTGLIVNSSFEECETGATKGVITGWTVDGRERLDWTVQTTNDHNSDGGKFIMLNKTGSTNNLVRPSNIVSQTIRTDLGEGTYVLTLSANVSRNNWRGDIDGWDKPAVSDDNKNLIKWSFGYLFIADDTTSDSERKTTFQPGATIIRECGQGYGSTENPKAPVYYITEQATNEDGTPKFEDDKPVMVTVERRGGFKVFHAFLTTSAHEFTIGFGIPDNPSPVDNTDATYTSVNGDGKAPYDFTGNKNWEADCLTSISKGGMRFDNVHLEFYKTDDLAAVKALYENKNDVNTGVDNVVVARPDDDVYYNIQGIRVDNPTRPGLYIKNGKKVMVR